MSKDNPKLEPVANSNIAGAYAADVEYALPQTTARVGAWKLGADRVLRHSACWVL